MNYAYISQRPIKHVAVFGTTWYDLFLTPTYTALIGPFQLSHKSEFDF